MSQIKLQRLSSGLLDTTRFALSSSLSAYSLTNHIHDQYTLTSDMINYTLTSSLSVYSLTSHVHNQYTLTADMINYTLTSSLSAYLPLSGGTITGSLSANSISSSINAINGFIFKVRTSDPISPIIGQA